MVPLDRVMMISHQLSILNSNDISAAVWPHATDLGLCGIFFFCGVRLTIEWSWVRFPAGTL